MSLEIIPVWKQITPELESELVQFWISNKAIGDAKKAAERAQQVTCLVRSESGEIVGVSTAHRRIVPRLRQPMYYYRNFITEDYRGRQLGLSFLQKSMEVLHQFNQSLAKPVSLGIILELENTSLAAYGNQAQWPIGPAGPTFIGYSPKGLHLRVWYFEGARLFAPAPLKKAVARASRN